MGYLWIPIYGIFIFVLCSVEPVSGDIYKLPPNTTTSKLSLHINGARGLDSNILRWITETQPRVIKLLDPSTGQDTVIKSASPLTVIIGRVYSANQSQGGDPVAAADYWYSMMKTTLNALPLVDFWEGFHEPGVGDIASITWMSQFEVLLVLCVQKIFFAY